MNSLMLTQQLHSEETFSALVEVAFELFNGNCVLHYILLLLLNELLNVLKGVWVPKLFSIDLSILVLLIFVVGVNENNLTFFVGYLSQNVRRYHTDLGKTIL